MSDWAMHCNYCQRSQSDLRRCTRCFMVYYCSKGCQSLDWSSHRISCTKPPNGASNGPRSSTAHYKTDTGEIKTSTQHLKQHEKANEDRYQVQGNDHDNERKTADANTDHSLTGVIKHATTDVEDGIIQRIEKPHVEGIDTGIRNLTGTCNKCHSTGCNLKCARCKVVFYCSKACQKEDWPLHKTKCHEVLENELELTDAEKEEEMDRGLQMQEERHRMCNLTSYRINEKNFTGPIERWHFSMLTPEQEKIHKTRPKGSLEKALIYAEYKFPQWTIITDFDEVLPAGYTYLWLHTGKPNVLVAFISMYHDHVMRHTVFLKDSKDKIIHVEFYFDDDPYPFFTYDQVKPGNYILIKHPGMRKFTDGQVGLRINHPSEVEICTVEAQKIHISKKKE